MAQKLNIPLYDIDQWRSLMNGGMLEIFLKGHLWIERCLEEFLNLAATHPEQLNIKRMTFANKLRLCHAFGLISDDRARILKKVNTLRNEVAHELSARVELDIADTLLNESTIRMRSAFDAMEEVAPPSSVTSPPSRLNRWFFTVVMDLGYEMLQFDYRQSYETELHAFAAVHVAREMDDLPPLSDERAREIAGLPEPPHPGHVWRLHPQTEQRAEGEGEE